MKTDPTTKVLLGVIATGIAALTALAFEKRYQRQLRPLVDDLSDSADHAYDRISRKTQQFGRATRDEAASLRDRFEEGVETLREKAGDLRERVSDGLERAGGHLRDGAEKLRDSLKTAATEVKDGAQDAAEVAGRAVANPKI
jgi:methyl-accepting chemotaxis protein